MKKLEIERQTAKIQRIAFFGILFFLVVMASCSGKNKPDTGTRQPTGDPVQIDRKTVIQDLCWSPDNRYVYFSAMNVRPDFSDYSPELWTVYRFDTNEENSELIAESALNVAVSPTGDQLAIAKNEGDGRSIYLLDKNGKNPAALVTGDVEVSAPAWSPDGQRISFTSTMSGREEIYSLRINDNQITQLTDSRGHKAYNPAWSPDGRFIAYYLEKGDGKDQIHVMRADGTENRNITTDTLNNIFPGWIDNNTIIYGQGHKNAPTKAYQVQVDGTNKKQVLQLESMYARYSPDESSIAYIDENEGVINIISADGKSLHKVVIPN